MYLYIPPNIGIRRHNISSYFIFSSRLYRMYESIVK